MDFLLNLYARFLLMGFVERLMKIILALHTQNLIIILKPMRLMIL